LREGNLNVEEKTEHEEKTLEQVLTSEKSPTPSEENVKLEYFSPDIPAPSPQTPNYFKITTLKGSDVFLSPIPVNTYNVVQSKKPPSYTKDRFIFNCKSNVKEDIDRIFESNVEEMKKVKREITKQKNSDLEKQLRAQANDYKECFIESLDASVRNEVIEKIKLFEKKILQCNEFGHFQEKNRWINELSSHLCAS